MSRIIHSWELADFCRNFGRVIPHANSNGEFSSFHCTDRSHDDSETVVFSAEQGSAKVGIGLLLMNGIVVEFDDRDNYLFCTKEEFERMIEEQKKQDTIEEEKMNSNPPISTNPARPAGVKITRDMMVIEYKSYEKCTIYPVKSQSLTFSSQLYASVMPCQEDCIFPTCPFYSKSNLSWKKYQHKDDYDDFIMTVFKDFT